jgi:putative chitinase
MSINFTEQQLEKIISGNQNTARWYTALMAFLDDYSINSPIRIAAFLSQCAHESAGFTAIIENLNYRPESLMRVWPRSFPTAAIAQQYGHNPEAIANRTYANRMGNGSEASGDGFKYCGRGLIQLTGKSNYQAFADSIETDISKIPEYLSTFEGCVQSACFFWESNNLNQYADTGDIVKITKIINGGVLGLDDRTARYQNALTVLGA